MAEATERSPRLPYPLRDMKALFRNLATALVTLLLIVTVWGHFVPRDEADALTAFDVLAVIVTVFGILVHSIVYTYFIASGKFAQTAIEEHGYPDPEAERRIKRNKIQAFRYAFIGMIGLMLAVSLYFAASPVRGDDAIRPLWAAFGAYAAILINLWAIGKEWKFIVANSVITSEITESVATAREQRLGATNSGHAGSNHE
ncbi:MAG: hypothetical protein ACF8PN_15770 [Phycisphaerales bacterium]